MDTTTLSSTFKESAPLADYLADLRGEIEEQLERLVPCTTLPYSRLFEAARYSLLDGGKRIRPILAIATAEALGCAKEQSIVPACALELIHTYSLIHDDLPCMDDDDFRRGKPSLHRAFPEAHAVLAGDFLLTHAFEVITLAPHLTAEQRNDLVKTLAQGAGGRGMVAGQILDIESEGASVNLGRLEEIHRLKTGALINAAVRFGSIIGQASKQEATSLQRYADNIGLAFQIIDDILDVTEGLKNNEKEYSSDIKNQKSTYVTLLGLDGAKEKAEALLFSATEALDQLPVPTSRLRELATLIIKRHA